MIDRLGFFRLKQRELPSAAAIARTGLPSAAIDVARARTRFHQKQKCAEAVRSARCGRTSRRKADAWAKTAFVGFGG
jgi:hypothetical protein